MDCSLSGSSVHGDSPGKNAGVGCHYISLQKTNIKYTDIYSYYIYCVLKPYLILKSVKVLMVIEIKLY